jgi:phosphate transport system protein
MEHTVKSYEQQLKRLDAVLVEMGGLCERQISAALEALSRRDRMLAEQTIAGDVPIDAMDREATELAVRVFALRQPLAADLRTVVGALRISSALERIGDYARNIAKRTVILLDQPMAGPVQGILRLGQLVQVLLKAVLDAYVARDAAGAVEVWKRDRELDDLYTSLFRESLTYMVEEPRNITACVHLLFIAKNLERIGDHATNIAETVYFIASGKPLAGERPKGGDRSPPPDTSAGGAA